MNKITVAGAIASKTGITLYLADGREMNLPTDSARTKLIVDEITAPLARGETVEMDLDTYAIETRIEKKTGGLIRFMRNKLSAIKESLFGKPVEEPAPLPTEAHPESKLAKMVDEIVADAIKTDTLKVGVLTTVTPAMLASVPAEPAPVVEEEEELVAIVETPTGPKIIQDVEHLSRHLEHAAFENVVGLQRFMERIASVIDERKHSVKELLNFMKKGDLPIADDGSIIAYKVLTSQGQRDGYFVDCHSKQVRQRVGSHVSMPVDRVDERRVQCSTGLHIARRGYLRCFNGDIITLVKVAPEDVVAVPPGEPDKMRAAAYHIIGKLPNDVHQTLRNNKPMTGNAEASKMLADAIAGNHIGIIERVRIGGPMGTEVEIVEDDTAAPAPKPFQHGEAKALDDGRSIVQPKDIRKAADEAFKQVRKAEQEVAEVAAEIVEVVEEASPLAELQGDYAGVLLEKINEEIDAGNNPFEEEEDEEVLFTEADDTTAEEDTVAYLEQQKAAPAAEPTETAAERSARRKREKRAAEKLARTGGASKAVSEPVVKPTTPAPATGEQKPLSEKDQAAIALYQSGKTLREVQAELKICRKRLGKLIKTLG